MAPPPTPASLPQHSRVSTGVAVVVAAGDGGRVAQTDGIAGLTHAFCDSQLAVWGSTSFPRFTYLFYASKYYEVLDTAILLLKGKKVGMLQSYHHCGAIWTMFAGYRAQAMPIWLFCVFNSFIHTIMYCYYAVTSLKLPFPQFLKRNITRLQITQFLLGGSLAASYLFLTLPDLPSLSSLSDSLPSALPSGVSIDALHTAAEGAAATAAEQWTQATAGWEAGVEALKREGERGAQCLVNAAQRSAVWLNVAYLIPLTYLFVAFFVKSYRRGPAAAGSKGGKAGEAGEAGKAKAQ
ncbi:hypothetical protein JCM6882_009473 [Rhodosporidiobolus microsporus]